MKRKAEGIALLSLYNDDEEEDEEEEEEERPQSDLIPPPSPSEAGVADSDAAAAGGASGIVDYAHDEAAMSPEAEEGEIMNTGRAVQVDSGVAEKPPVDAGVVTPEALPTLVETNTDAATLHQESAQEEHAAEENGTSNAEPMDLDLLSDFLPPPPTSKCSDELQSKFARYLALKNAGRSFNEELRNSKGYRNPDFLQHAVIYRGIDQIGSCFKKEIFDPHGYDPEDFHDALTLQQTRELERKDQERKQSQRVEFVRATSAITTATAVDSRSKSLVQMVQKSGAIAASIASSNNDSSGKPEGRSKKSKWDKVDTETRTISNLSVSAQNALAAATAHAALLSASAGAGYILAQQKRKEDEKSKTEKGFKSGKADRS